MCYSIFCYTLVKLDFFKKHAKSAVGVRTGNAAFALPPGNFQLPGFFCFCVKKNTSYPVAG